MIHCYGVLNSNGEHIDVSHSLLGAKQTATRNGYRKVSLRHGYNVVRAWSKCSGKWIEE